MDVLIIIFWFTLMLGPLVMLHELGHLLAARRFGVICYEYSIGVGPVIFSWQPGETRYSLRLLPLGGMVIMLEEHLEEVLPEESGRALTDKPLWQRAIIALAGPAMNLLIPVPIFFAFLTYANLDGVAPAVIGYVEPGGAADNSGLIAGDRILSVNGKTMRSFDQFQRRIKGAAGETLTLEIERDNARMTVQATPEMVQRRHDVFPGRIVENGRLGITLTQYGSVMDVLGANSVAALAGFRDFDAVHSVDGTRVSTWIQFDELVSAPGDHTVVVLRPEHTEDAWGDTRLRHALTLTLPGGVHAIEHGLASAQATIWSVMPGSPADQAGLRSGDRLLSVDETPVGDLAWAYQKLAVQLDTSTQLRVDRDGETLELTIRPFKRMVVAELNSEREEIFIGFEGYRTWLYPETEPMPPPQALIAAGLASIRTTAEATTVLVKGVAALVTGELPTSTIGGPIMIAHVASEAARNGFETFFSMMAMMSVNLGVLNLVPIPGLDGGRLAVIGLEAVKRGPLSSRTRQIINFIGLASLILLMVFVFKNDIERYWRSIADWLNS